MTSVQKARVRLVLEVIQYAGRNADEIGIWANVLEWEDDLLGNAMSLHLGTGEVITAQRGDWFIKGVHGVFVCRSAGFASAYELMEEA